MNNTLHIISGILVLAWIIIAITNCWGKPYTPAIILNIPWQGWAACITGCITELTACYLETRPNQKK